VGVNVVETEEEREEERERWQQATNSQKYCRSIKRMQMSSRSLLAMY
jgi:hypothetical protein